VSRVSEILTRLKTLSTQAVNGTLSNSERLISQEEFGQLVKQIDNTVNQTQLNGIKLLAGGANASFKAGTNVDSSGVVNTGLQSITGTLFDESSIDLSNYTGAVEGTIDDVRVTRNDANTNYIIEMDIKNGAQMETFRGEVSQTAADASTIQFKSTTNDNNGFTAVTDAVLVATAGTEDTMESELKQILGVGTGASEVVFRSANITESANAFRSDVTVVSNVASTEEYASSTAVTTVAASDVLTLTGSVGGPISTAAFTAAETIGSIMGKINAISEQTGVAATLKDTNGDGDLNLVLYSLDPASTFTLANGVGTPLTSLGLGTTSTAQTAGGYSNILSASSSTAAGRYTLTSSFDSHADTTTFRIQDQKGQTYDAVVKDVSDIGDNANLTTVSFSNGVELTFTNDQLRKTSSTLANTSGAEFQQLTFGSNNYEFRFDVEKSGKASVTTQVGLDAFNDLLTVELDSISTKELGITNASGANVIAIDTVGNAQAAQVVIDEAIDTLNKNTAKIGALQSRFSQIDTNLTTVIENSNAANGQFVDVDFAAESSNFYKNQALLQAAVGVAAQANQMPQQLLRLVG
jgi:flagellin